MDVILKKDLHAYELWEIIGPTMPSPPTPVDGKTLTLSTVTYQGKLIWLFSGRNGHYQGISSQSEVPSFTLSSEAGPELRHWRLNAPTSTLRVLAFHESFFGAALAFSWAGESIQEKPVLLLGCDGPLPLRLAPSRFYIPGLAAYPMAGVPLLEDRGFASRVAAVSGEVGCFDGSVESLANALVPNAPLIQSMDDLILLN